jgi:hypothetical protein
MQTDAKEMLQKDQHQQEEARDDQHRTKDNLETEV